MDAASYDLAKVGKRVVDYLWDPLPRNDDKSSTPILCLGRRYIAQPTESTDESSEEAKPPNLQESATDFTVVSKSDLTTPIEDSSFTVIPRADTPTISNEGWPYPFLEDFESRIWLTYRSGFAPIPRASSANSNSSLSFAVRLRNIGNQEGFTSDTGWGCMIRSGQMLLANAISILKLGRGWRRGQSPADERGLLSLFADDPQAPFSIHRFVEHGATACGKQPGEWFGPSATAQSIEALTEQSKVANLRVYSTGDTPDVYLDSYSAIANSTEDGTVCPVLILLGLRLGIDRVTPAYWDGLKAVFELPQSVGIAGGRTRASHYFLASQGDDFFYLDPHQSRPALRLFADTQMLTQEDVDSCHTGRLRRLNLREMDPSMLLAFLIRDGEDWDSFRDSLSKLPGKAIVHISDHAPGLPSGSIGREGAIDEVETFDTEDDEMS